MKEQLIEILGLPANSDEATIVSSVKSLIGDAAGEREISKLIAESGRALNREGAKQVLADRKTAATAQKKEKAKK